MTPRAFVNLARAATVLCLAVVVMGAWVRLSDAGLGCPDWPGCYGQLTWPNSAEQVQQANAMYPERPFEGGKAWREMAHRYAAGLLGLAIFALAALGWRRRRLPGQSVKLPLVLACLVVFQAVLGMWTVTWQLKPLVVMAHLLGGLATLSLLWWLALRADGRVPGMGGATTPAHRPDRALHACIIAATAVVVLQIALGGWTSANYAALACPDFPTCQGRWWPETDFREAFEPWRGLGVDYEFGVLALEARAAIQVSHRLGALVTAAVLAVLAVLLFRHGWRPQGAALLALLVAQLALGVANVLMRLPLPVAVGHNAVAALLLMFLVYLLHRASAGGEAPT